MSEEQPQAHGRDRRREDQICKRVDNMEEKLFSVASSLSGLTSEVKSLEKGQQDIVNAIQNQSDHSKFPWANMLSVAMIIVVVGGSVIALIIDGVSGTVVELKGDIKELRSRRDSKNDPRQDIAIASLSTMLENYSSTTEKRTVDQGTNIRRDFIHQLKAATAPVAVQIENLQKDVALLKNQK